MMVKKRILLWSLILSLALLFSLTVFSNAAGYPEKPIVLVVGYSAGGGTYLAAELLTPEAEKYLGQPINIVCKPGAGGSVGATYVAKSKPDGYTLLYATLSLPTSLYTTDVEYEQGDFIGVAMCSEICPVIAVRSDAPYNTADELVEWVKANPGKFTWGFPGVGSSLHLTGANAMEAMGISDLVNGIPFDGTTESVASVLGGHTSAVSCFPTSISEQFKAGNIKIIGVQAKTRMEDYPEVPTFLEQGYNATLTSWRGVFAPKDIPKDILEYLDKAFSELIASDEYYKRAMELGEGRAYKNAAEFTAFYNEQCESVKKVVEKLGLAIQK
ncbi:MAG: tripartite tricarboxylate transporter substrate binding protein [Candidatus Caldatribacteriota bacterium]